MTFEITYPDYDKGGEKVITATEEDIAGELARILLGLRSHDFFIIARKD